MRCFARSLHFIHYLCLQNVKVNLDQTHEKYPVYRFIYRNTIFNRISYLTFASKSLHKANMINLSNNAIICMHQDPDGYLWIGTYDGLNLYNGKDTYVYRFELNNKTLFVVISFTKYPTQNPAFMDINLFRYQ